MAVRILMGNKKTRNGYSLHECTTDGTGYKEEYSDDEDDVFVEDTSLDGLANASKPLMHPRHRTKVKSRRPECKCRSLCKPVLYFLLMVGLLGGLISILLYVISRHKPSVLSEPLLQGKLAGSDNQHAAADGRVDLIGCDQVEVEDVWVMNFPKLLTESAVRLVDVNQDGVLDVILGFGTGADGYNVPNVVCDIYFNSTHPCLGGLLALEGTTGKELWRHYGYHEMYAVNCEVDLNGDKVPDCLGAGRAGSFQAVSGRDGKLLWNYGPQESKNDIMNVYTPTYLRDIDKDGVPDFVVAHGGDPLAEPGSTHRLSGRLLVMSGRTGEVLSWSGVPDMRETYYSTQTYSQLDATPMLLFGTGGETHGGSLWVIPVEQFAQGRMDTARSLYTDKFKGVMTPPVLVDLTGDNVLDIVIAPFNSTVMAINGQTYDVIWNYSVPLTESYSTPAPGYYNDDDVPDFLIKLAYGPGFPVYFYSLTTILDGKTGKPLLQTPIQDSVGSQSSPLTISMEGKGHDLFLYWVADCTEHEGEGGEFYFVQGTNVHEQSRSDFCRLRFKTVGFSKFLALSSSIKPRGATVYFSEERKKQERQGWVNTTAEALEFLRTHPEHLNMYERYKARADFVDNGRVSSSSSERPAAGRRKGALPSPHLNQEGYNSQYGPPPATGTHSLGAKKGPQLPPQRGGNQIPPRQHQQQRLPEQQQVPQDRQYEKYDGNPFAPDVNNPYSLPDLEDSLYPRRGQAGNAQDDGYMFGYPYGTGQQDEYSRYYPDNNYANDRYGNRDGRYGNRNQPYGNYYQKRDQDPASPYESSVFSDGEDNPQDLLMKLAAETAGAASQDGRRHRQKVQSTKHHSSSAGVDWDSTAPSVRQLTQSLHSRVQSGRVKQRLEQSPENLRPKPGGQSMQTRTASQHRSQPLDGVHIPSAEAQDGVVNTNTASVGVRGELPQSQPTSSAHKHAHSHQTSHSSLAVTLPSGSTHISGNLSGHQPALSDQRQATKGSVSRVREGVVERKHSSATFSQNRHTSRKIEKSGVDPDTESDSPAQRPNAASASAAGSDVKADVSQGKSTSITDNRKKKRDDVDQKSSNTSGFSQPQFMKRKRKRRHVGPHDDNGLQRLLSTGAVTPSTLPPDHPDYPYTMDVVFATYWFFPAKTQAILPGDQKCIADKLSQEEQRFDPKNKYYGMDHDAYEHAATNECLQASDHQLSDNGVFESQNSYNPYSVNMGEMTVYRVRIKCKCSQVANTTEGKRCAKMMPFDKQQWPAYLGRHGDSHWLPRK